MWTKGQMGYRADVQKKRRKLSQTKKYINLFSILYTFMSFIA